MIVFCSFQPHDPGTGLMSEPDSASQTMLWLITVSLVVVQAALDREVSAGA